MRLLADVECALNYSIVPVLCDVTSLAAFSNLGSVAPFPGTTLIISGFTGNPFAKDDLLVVPNVGALLPNVSAIGAAVVESTVSSRQSQSVASIRGDNS